MPDRFKSTLFLVLALLAGNATSTAGAGTVSVFHADFTDARWSLEESVFECRLVQKIPHLGDAVFYHEAGENLEFYLSVPASPLREGRALLTSMPPAWRHELSMRDLGYVDVVRSDLPVRLDAARSRLLVAELSRGMMPTLMRQAWYNDEESIQIGISPVNFSAVMHDYQGCVAQLLPVNFAQIERSTIFWQPNQTALDAASRQLLDNIAAYAKADPSVYGFEINGFTDSLGTPRQNLELSRTRAFLVHEYLVRQGIDESLLATRYFGSVAEYRIIRDEQSAADRDRNRRVTVRVLRR